MLAEETVYFLPGVHWLNQLVELMISVRVILTRRYPCWEESLGMFLEVLQDSVLDGGGACPQGLIHSQLVF